MPFALPGTSALLMMECQKGVLDTSGKFAALVPSIGLPDLEAAIRRVARARGRRLGSG